MNQVSSKFTPIGYANFMQRFNAFVIDSLVFVPFSILGEYNVVVFKQFLITIFIAVAWWVYKIGMEWKFGATLGKMFFRIRVVDHEMQLLPFNQVLLRFAPYFAISLSALLLNFTLFNLDGFQEASAPADIYKLQKELTNGEGLFLSSFFFIFSTIAIFFNEKKQAAYDRFSDAYCILIQPKEKQSFFIR